MLIPGIPIPNSTHYSNLDGMLVVLLTTIPTTGGGSQITGDFFFENSTLTAQATIPEPGTLALLSLGLAGFGYARCRKAQKV